MAEIRGGGYIPGGKPVLVTEPIYRGSGTEINDPTFPGQPFAWRAWVGQAVRVGQAADAADAQRRADNALAELRMSADA